MAPFTLRFSLFLSANLVACGSSGGAGGSAGREADAEVAPVAGDCASIASDLCQKAVACGTGTVAPVLLGEGSSRTVYESESYCTKVFTEQCGPDTPETDNPRVADPSVCAQEMATAVCRGEALAVPVGCGGHG